MSNFNKIDSSGNETRIVVFVSRNKDNRGLKCFRERRESFITTRDVIDDLQINERFIDFVSHGVYGELSRMYVSVNRRSPKKIYTHLMHFMFDNPDFNLCAMEQKISGIAASKDCDSDRKWMFDFDINDLEKVEEFKEDIKQISGDPDIIDYTVDTINGYAVVVKHGFDTRKLLAKWKDVELKRDDLVLVQYGEKLMNGATTYTTGDEVAQALRHQFPNSQ